MKHRAILYLGTMACLLLMACQDKEELAAGDGELNPDRTIRVGGVSADNLMVRAVGTRDGEQTDDEEGIVSRKNAEEVSWLVNPLKTGLYISYGDADNRSVKKLAKLKLETDGEGIKYSADEQLPGGKVAVYSFKYLDSDKDAQWLDNGAHFFEGQYVPDKIKYTGDDVSAVNGTSGTAPNLGSDQSKDGDDGNYTLLSRYLAMPSDHYINATVARVKLPFRHRLARVIAYILIDPDMGNTKIKGYNYSVNGGTVTPDDPATSSIHFCNVKVLAGVKDEESSGGLHTYTPQWVTTPVRKAIPHFVAERGCFNDSLGVVIEGHGDNFISYYDNEKKVYIDPMDAQWKTITQSAAFTEPVEGQEAAKLISNDKRYERIKYGMVPVYDLIIQPTYTTLGRVMYDEEGVNNAANKQSLYVATNQIDFEVVLDNGLHYTKSFAPLDLDANYQTVVYLHISRERVDYNSSGSSLWVETVGSDDWYGVNNRNGNTLSIAGSSWQRAYTNGLTGSGHPSIFDDKVTDGHFYTHDSEDEKAQYVTDAKWIEMFFEAKKDGAHHGDYFILDHDITIAASEIPANFVFTGHLDGQDHAITVTVSDSRSYLFDGLNGTYTTAQESNESATWEANVHKEKNGKWVPTSGWRAEIINTKFTIDGGSIFKDDATTTITGYVHNCWLNGARVADHIEGIPEYR